MNDIIENSVAEIAEQEFENLTDHIESTPNDDLGEIEINEITEQPPKEDTERAKEQPKQEGTPLGQLLPAPFVINLTNIAFPVLIVLSFKLFGYSTNKKEYQLNATEIKTLEEPLQKYLDYIKINLNNPLYNLLLALSIVYGSKVIEGAQKAEKIKKTKKQPETMQEAVNKAIQEKDAVIEQQAKEIVEEAANTNEWIKGYNQEQIALINATKKKRNRGYKDAIDWLEKKNLLTVAGVFN